MPESLSSYTVASNCEMPGAIGLRELKVSGVAGPDGVA